MDLKTSKYCNLYYIHIYLHKYMTSTYCNSLSAGLKCCLFDVAGRSKHILSSELLQISPAK